MKMTIVVMLAIIVGFFGGVGQAAISSVCSPDSGALLLVGSTVVGFTMWARRKVKR